MTKFKIAATGAALVAALGVVCSPVLASQSSKNTWRNLTIGSGAVGVLGLLHHNTTETVLGAAGAAYSANRYEQDRHHQSQARQRKEAHARWLHEQWERDHHA